MAMNIRASDIWFVIPAYNESKVIRTTLGNIRQHFPLAQIILIDDGSSDSTRSEIDGLGLHYARHISNLGQGAALRTGIDFALARDAKVLITFDADGQHDARSVPALISPVINGQVDIALGSRFLNLNHTEAVPLRRRWLLRLAIWFTRWTTGLTITDTHNGLRCFSRRAAQILSLDQKRMAHASEILFHTKKMNLKFVEIPVEVRYSRYSLRKGQSALSVLPILLDLLKTRRKQRQNGPGFCPVQRSALENTIWV